MTQVGDNQVIHPGEGFMTSTPVPTLLPNVIVTMTTCKRLQLFQSTMRTIAQHWTQGPAQTIRSGRDPRVLEWVVVDDNSSDSDRAAMVWEFGAHTTFVFKPSADKGHVNSMNLILARVRASGAKWWVHLEDDWDFVVKRDYIGDAIACLESYPHLGQVMFNVNYAQKADDLDGIVGDKVLDDHFSEHVYQPDTPFPYRNAHYWPHFSLRPSLIRVQALEKVEGDFSCPPHAFFELDFARRWTAAGLRTGFFRVITCLHSGRLVEDAGKPHAVPNAYQLNGVSQFGSAPPAGITDADDVEEEDTSLITREPGRAKVRVRILPNWATQEAVTDMWAHYLPQDSCLELVRSSEDASFDYTVVLNSTCKPHDPSRTVVYTMEPWVDDSRPWGVHTWGLWARPDPAKYLKVFSHDRELNAVMWQTSWTWDDYETRPILKDPRVDRAVAMVCSAKYFDPGHILRLDLARALCADSGVDLRFYSQAPVTGVEASYAGRADEYKDKEKGLHPYKYYLMFENNREHNFITEKLWEPLLAEALCFYWGAPNVTEVVDARAVFVLDPEGTIESWARDIKAAIADDAWAKALPFIRAEKERVLHKLSFFRSLEPVLEEHRARASATTTGGDGGGCDDDWEFVPGLDSFDGDLGRLAVVDKQEALRRGAVAINTLGFYKKNLNLPFKPTPWIHAGIPNSGLFVLKRAMQERLAQEAASQEQGPHADQ
jgi:hypothetical protein